MVPVADFSENVLQYQFKPYCQSDKYIAVVDGKVVLKVGILHSGELMCPRMCCNSDTILTNLTWRIYKGIFVSIWTSVT